MVYRTTMCGDDLPRDRQADPGALRLRGLEELEDVDAGGYAGSAVADRDADPTRMHDVDIDRDLPWTGAYGFQGVLDQVVEDPSQHHLVAAQAAHLGAIDERERDPALAGESLPEIERGTQKRRDLDLGQRQPLVAGEVGEVPNEIFQSAQRVQDLLGRLLHRRCGLKIAAPGAAQDQLRLHR